MGDKKSQSFGFLNLNKLFFSLKFNLFQYRFCYRFKKQKKDKEFFSLFNHLFGIQIKLKESKDIGV
jgi:hypothetical protein